MTSATIYETSTGLVKAVIDGPSREYVELQMSTYPGCSIHWDEKVNGLTHYLPGGVKTARPILIANGNITRNSISDPYWKTKDVYSDWVVIKANPASPVGIANVNGDLSTLSTIRVVGFKGADDMGQPVVMEFVCPYTDWEAFMEEGEYNIWVSNGVYRDLVFRLEVSPSNPDLSPV